MTPAGRPFLATLKRSLASIPGLQGWVHRLRRLRAGRQRSTADHAFARSREEFRREARARMEDFLAGQGRFTVPPAAAPEVSVVLILFNNAELSFECLRHLVAADLPAWELIVVDNASADDTGRLLECCAGARIIRNGDNLGFLQAVNQAAEVARGRFLLLLNSDAFLAPDAVRLALETASDPAVGAVGGRIVLPDGSLQEAGSIVWNDGTCKGYGRGGHPLAGPYMFRRTVDYCSGAFLLFRREVFERLGRFDTAFSPAYYEETDFCLRLWAAGLAVVYDPRVRVNHLEFGSSEKRDHALELQRRNRGLFAAKHRDALARRQPPGADLAGRVWPPPVRRVLIVDDRPPAPELGAGFPRALAILRQIQGSGAAVTLVTTAPETYGWEAIRRHVPWEVEVVQGDDCPSLDRFLAERFLAGRGGCFDLVLVSRPHNMRAFLAAGGRRRIGSARLVYDAEAIFTDRLAGEAALAGRPLPAAREAALRAREMALARQADTVIAVSPLDADAMRRAGVADVRVIGHALDAAPTPAGPEARSGLLFVGNMDADLSPNVDGVLWFLDEVLPLLPEAVRDRAAVTLVGSAGSARLAARVGGRAVVAGRQPALEPFYDRHRVFIAPTRFAAGIPHKVHEAAAHGLPVVGTPLLARQLGWEPGQELLTGENPAEIALACTRLLTDDGLWRSVRTAALAAVTRDCGPDRFRAAVAALLD
ncbi:glycosyltransferase [Rhodocista pekingensis]|uniref:Glycosyltransferase n=1 Tax=Rhodocista pekingensis TaxID=201185 RepID=A0ABW2L219_9PROT